MVLIPVSYTHLDVYKRQGLYSYKDGPFKISNGRIFFADYKKLHINCTRPIDKTKTASDKPEKWLFHAVYLVDTRGLEPMTSRV